MDYYKVLGLSRDCNIADLKKTYRELSLIFHPDKNPGNELEATETFKMISNAYTNILDELQQTEPERQQQQEEHKRQEKRERQEERERQKEEYARQQQQQQRERERQEKRERQEMHKRKRQQKDHDRLQRDRALMEAAADGDLPGIFENLMMGADVNYQDSAGFTALHYAAFMGYIDVTQELLRFPRIKVNTKDNDGKTPLSWACVYDYLDIIKFIQNAGGEEYVEGEEQQQQEPEDDDENVDDSENDSHEDDE
ncbi:unnamed protein product, partial [Meganyctiphanes norvegica]